MIRTLATPVNALVGPATHRHVRSGQPHRKMDGRLELPAEALIGPDTRGVEPDVRSWPKADIASCTAHVRFRG